MIARQVLIGICVLLIGCGIAEADNESHTITLGKNVRALHFREGSKVIEVTPAFEDYMYMMFDTCDAMGLTIESGDCSIDPLNGDVAGGAVAFENESGKYIIYNRRISPMLGYQGAASVIAHEIGHHYCGHLKKKHTLKHELEADRFAGAAMKRMRYSKEDAVFAVSALMKRPSKTHPGRDERIKWTLMGWDKPETAFDCR